MSEFQLALLQDQEISSWDFYALKSYLEQVLEPYRSALYLDEKTAKNDKSELNKIKKLIEDKRKEFKARCLEPYEAVEPQIKELVSMIDAQRELIDKTVRDYEQQRKDEKEAEIRKIFGKKSVPLGEYSDKLYKKFFDQKWLNKSCSKAEIEQDIISLVSLAADEIGKIRELNSPFVETLLDEYAERATFDEVVAKNDYLLNAAGKAGIAKEKSTPVQQRPVQVSVGSGTVFRILRASSAQLEQIKDFMTAIGVEFEIEQV